MEYIYNLEVFTELEWTVIMLEKKNEETLTSEKYFFNKLFNKIRSLVKILRFFVLLKNIGIYR